MATFSKALELANTAHFDKKDMGGKSYILHTLRVAMRLRTNDEELMSIAVMHDTVEDGNVTFDQLKEYGFSDRVVSALRLLTHQKGVSYDDYIEAMRGNIDALKIKREDLRDNSDITRLKGVRDKDVQRMIKYQKAFLKVEQYIKEIESNLN
jgi:GTP diphosphokinase / guanosine-3',5'-bis(diphosphate) 3'-diphosphatase